MGHSHTDEAIILKTYDVGEADRFCILLTRTKGRMAARAPGVRKPKSKMGGSVLPLRHVTVELKDSSAGWMIASAQGRNTPGALPLRGFVEREQCIEMLLCVLHDEEPLPEIFTLALELLHWETAASPVLPFTLRLLSLLGLLPPGTNEEFFGRLNDGERTFVDLCASPRWREAPPLPAASERRVQLPCSRVIAEQGGRMLRAAETGAVILG